MQKFLKDLCHNIFVTWLFSQAGAAFIATLVATGMTYLVHLTEAFQTYKPASYGFVFFISIILILLIIFVMMHIVAFIKKIEHTDLSTFVEYKIENGVAYLTKKSNIYKEPSSTLMDIRFVEQTEQPAHNRTQKRTPVSKIPVIPQVIGQERKLNLLIVFNKPIKPENFLVRMEPLFGKLPTRDISSIDERWCSIALSNVQDNSSFRIRFN